MTLQYNALFKLSKNVPNEIAHSLIDQLISTLCQEKNYDVRKSVKPLATYFVNPIYGTVSIVLLWPIHIIDPLLNNADDLVITRKLYDAYMQQQVRNFKHSEYALNQARIWPKFHYLEGKNYVFARFGYIRDRIGHVEEKKGYRLEFTNELLGNSVFSAVESTVTTVPDHQTLRLDHANNERCMKNTALVRVDDPFVEIKILEKMPYTVYGKKAAIFFQDTSGKRRLLIPQKRQPGQSLDKWIETTPELILSDAFDIVISYLQKLADLHQFALHRDIKPNNIMVFRDENNKLNARLIDFGLSILNTEAIRSPYKVGVKACWAPEIHGPLVIYSKQSDLYAAIIIMLDLLRLLKLNTTKALTSQTGSLETHEVCLTLIMHEMEKEITYVSAQAKKMLINLVKEGLAFDAKSRPPIEDVIQRLTVLKQMTQPDYTENVASELAEALKTSRIYASIDLIRKALDKVTPNHFPKFKWILKLECLRPCKSIENVKEFLNALEVNIPKTDPIIFSVSSVLNAVIGKLNGGVMTAPKIMLRDFLYQQIQYLTYYQKYQPTTIDEWHAWHDRIKNEYGEESIIYPTIRWLINRFILEKTLPALFFVPYGNKENIYPILTTLCSQETTVAKLLAVQQLLQVVSPVEISLLCAELNMPQEASLDEKITQKINELQAAATVVSAVQYKS